MKKILSIITMVVILAVSLVALTGCGDKNGKVDTRTIYGDNGLISKQIHTTDHGNPKWHKRGLNGEHVQVFEWNDEGTYKGKTERELSTEERKEHSDIL